jgi:hypothetical protein
MAKCTDILMKQLIDKRSGYHRLSNENGTKYSYLSQAFRDDLPSDRLVYFSASSLLSSETVRGKIRVYLLEKTGAAVSMALRIQLFPLPKIISEGWISIPDKGKAQLSPSWFIRDCGRSSGVTCRSRSSVSKRPASR